MEAHIDISILSMKLMFCFDFYLFLQINNVIVMGNGCRLPRNLQNSCALESIKSVLIFVASQTMLLECCLLEFNVFEQIHSLKLFPSPLCQDLDPRDHFLVVSYDMNINHGVYVKRKCHGLKEVWPWLWAFCPLDLPLQGPLSTSTVVKEHRETCHPKQSPKT